jgi:hypothetical protein
MPHFIEFFEIRIPSLSESIVIKRLQFAIGANKLGSKPSK